MTLPERIDAPQLERRPVIDLIEPQMLKLIKATVASDQGITDAEIAYFLELASQYQLDPFAREVWIAKSKSGKLLIMVGRDGLRRIVDRNGLLMRGAAIHANDTFSAEYIDNPTDAKPGEWEAHGHAPFTRVVHKRAGFGPDGRGDVAGAWARVTDRQTNVERAYFDAPLSEYMPSKVSEYSPWSKQTSAMMLGAVERQAARQATPLGGLLMDGEQFVVSDAVEIGAGEGDGTEPGWDLPSEDLVADVEALLSNAAEFGHPLDRATVQMRLNGQKEDVVRAYVVDTTEMLAKPKAEPEGGGDAS